MEKQLQLEKQGTTSQPDNRQQEQLLSETTDLTRSEVGSEQSSFSVKYTRRVKYIGHDGEKGDEDR